MLSFKLMTAFATPNCHQYPMNTLHLMKISNYVPYFG